MFICCKFDAGKALVSNGYHISFPSHAHFDVKQATVETQSQCNVIPAAASKAELQNVQAKGGRVSLDIQSWFHAGPYLCLSHKQSQLVTGALSPDDSYCTLRLEARELTMCGLYLKSMATTS